MSVDLAGSLNGPIGPLPNRAHMNPLERAQGPNEPNRAQVNPLAASQPAASQPAASQPAAMDKKSQDNDYIKSQIQKDLREFV